MANLPGKVITDDFEDSRDYVQSLARGLSALRAFDSDHTHLSLAEIAQRAQLSRAVARRLVLTLEHLGYVRQVGRTFALSPRVLEFGFGYLGTLNISDLAQPLLEDLARRIDQSCSMAVLEPVGDLLRVPGRRVMTVSLGIGARLPAAATSMGRGLLAGLPEASRDWLADAAVRHPAYGDRQEEARPDDRAGRMERFAYVEQELELGFARWRCHSTPRQECRRHQYQHALPPGCRPQAGWSCCGFTANRGSSRSVPVRNPLPAVSL
jgi:IclR family pca regulon transcriptional regulator